MLHDADIRHQAHGTPSPRRLSCGSAPALSSLTDFQIWPPGVLPWLAFQVQPLSPNSRLLGWRELMFPTY